MGSEQVLVVQETEYSGAGKHPTAQLSLARQLGIAVRRGDPRENRPGRNIVIPEHPSQLAVVDLDLAGIRLSYLRNALAKLEPGQVPSQRDIEFLAADSGAGTATINRIVEQHHAQEG